MHLYSLDLQKLYVALFARPADPQGYIWLDAFSNHGQDYSQIDLFTGTDEYITRFTGQQFDDGDNYNRDVLNVLYQGMFNRDVDPDGLAFYGNMLDTGEATMATIALWVMTGAEGDDLLTLTNKARSAQQFTDRIDTPDEMTAYSGAAGIAAGQIYLDPVGSDPGSIPSAEETETAILGLSGDWHMMQ